MRFGFEDLSSKLPLNSSRSCSFGCYCSSPFYDFGTAGREQSAGDLLNELSQVSSRPKIALAVLARDIVRRFAGDVTVEHSALRRSGRTDRVLVRGGAYGSFRTIQHRTLCHNTGHYCKSGILHADRVDGRRAGATQFHLSGFASGTTCRAPGGFQSFTHATLQALESGLLVDARTACCTAYALML